MLYISFSLTMIVLYKCWNNFTKLGITLMSSFFFTPALKYVLLSRSTHTCLLVPIPYLLMPSSITDTIKLKFRSAECKNVRCDYAVEDLSTSSE